MTSKSHARARVQVTLEIDLSDRWGNDCKMDQIYKQAKDEALGIINRKFSDEYGRVRIVGQPKVTAILTEEER